MSFATWFTLACVALVLYTYIGYPVLIALKARMSGGSIHEHNHGKDDSTDAAPPEIAIVLAVRNEQDHVRRRIIELERQAAAAGFRTEIIVAVNGSTDDTAEVAGQTGLPNIRVIRTDAAGGKAAAITAAIAATRMPIVLLADARQRWNDDAIPRLVRAFADPGVGGVSGELVLEESPGVMAGVGVYWRYEKWIRRNESRSGSQVGVTGAIAAVRRDCFVPIPDGTILDDVCWPMNVALGGSRVISVDGAIAYDQLPDQAADELRRKVRTLAGNLQLVRMQPELLMPFRNPIWGRFVSHKLLRLVCPWALIGIIAGGLAMQNVLGFLLATAVFAAGCVGGVAMLSSNRRQPRWMAAAGSFFLLNYAAVLAAWFFATGRVDRLWQPKATLITTPETTA